MAEVNTKCRTLESIILYNSLCTMDAGETMLQTSICQLCGRISDGIKAGYVNRLGMTWIHHSILYSLWNVITHLWRILPMIGRDRRWSCGMDVRLCYTENNWFIIYPCHNLLPTYSVPSPLIHHSIPWHGNNTWRIFVVLLMNTSSRPARVRQIDGISSPPTYWL